MRKETLSLSKSNNKERMSLGGLLEHQLINGISISLQLLRSQRKTTWKLRKIYLLFNLLFIYEFFEFSELNKNVK